MAKKHKLEDVLKVGDQLFRQKGYHATGTDEILKAANFPRSSFYYHFDSKEGFGVKTLTYYGQQIEQYLGQFLQDESVASPFARIKNYFFHIIDYSTETEFATCCLIHHFSIETSAQEGPLQAEAHTQFQSWVASLAACIKEAQAQGEIQVGRDPEELAYYVFSLLYGMFTFTRLNRDSARYRKLMALGFELIEA